MHKLDFLRRRLSQRIVEASTCNDEFGIHGFAIQFQDGKPIVLTCIGSGGLGSFKGFGSGVELTFERVDLPADTTFDRIEELSPQSVLLAFGNCQVELKNYDDKLEVRVRAA